MTMTTVFDRLEMDLGWSVNNFGDVCLIETPIDKWQIEKRYGNNNKIFYEVGHLNKSGNFRKKEHYHIQKRTNNLYDAVKSITHHDFNRIGLKWGL